MAYYSEDLIEEVISQNDIVDVISFIKKLENLDFWDSVEYLAERAHIDLERFEVKSFSNSNANQQERKDLKETLFKLNKEVAMYYHNNLVEELKATSSRVKDYVSKRKFDTNTLTKFGIGYATGRVPLYDHLKKQGFDDEVIFKSGIILKNERGKIYDRFFNRLIFPIFDIRDRVIAFGGRVLDNSLPKYVNSPENEIYFKGKNLYALNLAKREKLENVIIVEGYMDAIALQKSGFTNAVASLGTALTDNQARLLKKYTDTVIIGYDQDGAGQAATLRGLDILVSKGLKVKVLILDRDDVKDPDEYINKYGKERFKNCLDNCISLVEFKVSKLEKELNENDIDSKINFLTQVANILAQIDNTIERDIYIDRIAKKYNIGSGPILKEVEKRIKKVQGSEVVIDVQSINRKMSLVTNIRKRQEQYIIALLLSKDKRIQEEILNKVSIDDIQDEKVKQVYSFIIDLKENYDINKIDILSKVKDEELMKELTDIMYLDMSNVDKNKLLNDVLKNKLKEKLYLRRDEILKRLDEDISKDEQEVLQLELNQILMEMSKLKK